MPSVLLSIGSNLGDRVQNLRDAVLRLEGVMVKESLEISGLYETEPVGCPPGSPAFLNAVIAFETDLAPEPLLDALQQIEGDLGRPLEREVNAPRLVDLDLLRYDDLKIATARLTLPHPRMMVRAFVLCPLAEIRSEFAGAAERSDQGGVVRLPDPLFNS